MEITWEELVAKIKERKEFIVSGLATCDGNELFRYQGDFRTLEWLLELPERIEAEQEMDRERHFHADNV